MKNYPREIVFDGQYLWVSHNQFTEDSEEGTQYYLHLSIIDPHEWEVIATHKEPLPNATSTIKSMAFDGNATWVIYDTEHGNGL
ncbi:MAG: hypothetical protein GWN00_14005, partial [Aliifodinibius sp.]|nr:hypothetical protein [Fodinibius sp.]NIY25880.1 hypothetical protein [Fodinibius sp.]